LASAGDVPEYKGKLNSYERGPTRGPSADFELRNKTGQKERIAR